MSAHAPSDHVRLHPHAVDRLPERGVTAAEAIATVLEGERFPARLGRTGFRRNFPYRDSWRGRWYAVKQVEAFAVQEEGGWLVITVIARYF